MFDLGAGHQQPRQEVRKRTFTISRANVGSYITRYEALGSPDTVAETQLEGLGLYDGASL